MEPPTYTRERSTRIKKKYNHLYDEEKRQSNIALSWLQKTLWIGDGEIFTLFYSTVTTFHFCDMGVHICASCSIFYLTRTICTHPQKTF